MKETPLSPTAQSEAAKQAYERGDLEAAIAGFKSAKEGYQEAGEHLSAAEMSNNLSVALLKDNQIAAALTAVTGTAELFLEADEKERAAMAYGNLASALEMNGEMKSAETALEEAIRIFKEIGSKDNLMHSTRALSQIQLRQGRTIEAVSTMQTGLEEQSRLSIKNRIVRAILRVPSRLLGR